MASLLTSGRPNSLAGIGHKPSALVAAGSEIYDCLRFCAMFDKAYIARYERKPGKLFQLIGTFKVATTAGVEKSKPSTTDLRFDQISTWVGEERCSWCGVKGLVKCGNCSQFICYAHVSKRNGGLYFRCRTSCKHEDMIDGLIETLEGSKRAAPSRHLAPSLQPHSLGLRGKGSAAALVPGRLRLKS